MIVLRAGMNEIEIKKSVEGRFNGILEPTPLYV